MNFPEVKIIKPLMGRIYYKGRPLDSKNHPSRTQWNHPREDIERCILNAADINRRYPEQAVVVRIKYYFELTYWIGAISYSSNAYSIGEGSQKRSENLTAIYQNPFPEELNQSSAIESFDLAFDILRRLGMHVEQVCKIPVAKRRIQARPWKFGKNPILEMGIEAARKSFDAIEGYPEEVDIDLGDVIVPLRYGDPVFKKKVKNKNKKESNTKPRFNLF